MSDNKSDCYRVARLLVKKYVESTKYKQTNADTFRVVLTDEQILKSKSSIFKHIWAEPIARLESRKVIIFNNRDIFEPFYTDWEAEGEDSYDLTVNIKNLNSFIKDAELPAYGLTHGDYLTDVAAYGLVRSLLEAEKNTMTGWHIHESWSRGEYVASWLEDYSGLVSISREIKPVVVYDLGRYESQNLDPEINTVELTKEIEQATRILKLFQKSLHNHYEERLTVKLPLRWVCIPNKHFIDELDYDKLAKYQDDFFVGKYRACGKCRSKNYFHIEKDGKVTFSAYVQDTKNNRRKTLDID